jgi:hypothetical protein
MPVCQVEAVISALREKPLAVELPTIAEVSAADCEQLLKIGFGRFVFAPASLQSLENRVSAAEIVRFPSSPYEIVRNYWGNVASLTDRVAKANKNSLSTPTFVAWLRELHVRLLLGEYFDSFYCPSSPIVKQRVSPGALYTKTTRSETSPLGTFILEGPRINASTVGGKLYHQMLEQSLAGSAVEFAYGECSDQGINWGSLVSARTHSEEHDQDWFLPPRPMQETHWERLSEAWKAASCATEALDPPGAIREAASFHWYFVHLHPFACANQSLSFALVNYILRGATGSGIPHLVLDHLALRIPRPGYEQLFSRAAKVWSTPESEPALRHRDRMQKRQRLDGFIARLNSASDLKSARAIVDADQGGARLALLSTD